MKKFSTIVCIIIALISCWSVMASAASYDTSIGVPAVAGTIEITAFHDSSRLWKPGESLTNVSTEVKPCGHVTSAYYNDNQTAIFIVDVDPNIVYFVSNGLATVNGEKAMIKQTGKDRYEVCVENKDATSSEKQLVITVKGMQGVFKFEVTAFDEAGNAFKKVAVDVSEDHPIALTFPKEVCEVRIHEIAPSDYTGAHHPDIQVRLEETTKLSIDSGNRSVESSNTSYADVLQKIMDLISRLLSIIHNIGR